MVMVRSLCWGVCVGVVGWGAGQPVEARPAIASGDRLLTTPVAGCLAAADQFIAGLDIQSEQGDIDRTGYFDDGAFRIVCYAAGEASLAVVFASHDHAQDVVTNFIQHALDTLVLTADLGIREEGPQSAPPAEAETGRDTTADPPALP